MPEVRADSGPSLAQIFRVPGDSIFGLAHGQHSPCRFRLSSRRRISASRWSWACSGYRSRTDPAAPLTEHFSGVCVEGELGLLGEITDEEH